MGAIDKKYTSREKSEQGVIPSELDDKQRHFTLGNNCTDKAKANLCGAFNANSEASLSSALIYRDLLILWGLIR